MSKHTPGPWTVEDREERLLIWADGSHDFIAQLDTVADGVDDQKTLDAYLEEQEANARLIAAAPELLRALQQLVDAYDADRDTPLPEEDIDLARAALTKARGES